MQVKFVKLPNETNWQYVKRMYTENTVAAVVGTVIVVGIVCVAFSKKCRDTVKGWFKRGKGKSL